jgi:uncharacterized Zn finger protein
MTTYKVTIKNAHSFIADQRRRAGIVVSKDDGYEGELDADQLAEIKADDYLEVDEIKPELTPEEVEAKKQAAKDAKAKKDADAKAKAEAAKKQAAA